MDGVAQPSCINLANPLRKLETLYRPFHPDCTPWANRHMISANSVAIFAAGDWDGTPFVAELFKEPVNTLAADIQPAEAPGVKIFLISDGMVKLPVNLSPNIIAEIRDDYCLVEISEADYQKQPETTLITKMPGMQCPLHPLYFQNFLVIVFASICPSEITIKNSKR